MHDTVADLVMLERELPALARLRRFAATFDRVGWFTDLGEVMPETVRRTCQAYLEALGMPEAQIAILVDWEDAAAAAETQDWSSPSWEIEELARADLTGRALDIVSQEALQLGVSMIADRAAQTAKEALEQASALWDLAADQSLYNLAVGSAVQGAHNAGLVLLAAAAEPDMDAAGHLFAQKFNLFQAGRWPVGTIGSSFNIF